MSDNTPAFPEQRRVHRMGYATDEFQPVSGMTLRDYFAAKAMQALIARVPYDATRGISRETMTTASYEFSDAMLKARES